MQSNFWAQKLWTGTKHFGTCKRTRYWAKIFLILYPPLENSTTRIAIACIEILIKAGGSGWADWPFVNPDLVKCKQYMFGLGNLEFSMTKLFVVQEFQIPKN